MRWFPALVLSTCLAGCSNGYSTTDVPDASASGDSGGTTATCTDACPKDACGLVKLSCGPTDCGTCTAANDKCVDGKCQCVPQTCAQIGAQCGTAPDGCGGQIFCGSCSEDGGTTDGGGALTCGATYSCMSGPCVPKIPSVACYSPSVRLCGKQPDGCGGTVDCGTSACSGVGETCGGGGTAGVCGCKPLPGCAGPCSSQCPNGCGGMRTCNCSNCH